MTFTRTTPRALTIVGPGKVGQSLQQAALSAGIKVRLIGRQQLEAGQAWPGGGAAESHDLLLLAVPDDEIANACETACAGGRYTGPVGHLSGATGLSALAAAEQAGLATFSMHPLQSFASTETGLGDIPCAVTATDSSTTELVFQLARQLGMSPFALAEADRVLYHAAASMASNFLVCLEQEAAGLIERIGIADGRRLLTPLVTQTFANWSRSGGAALTGPIVRGDEATVERHLAALRERAPELVDLYLAMAERTRALAADRPTEPKQGDREVVGA